jgi:cbb3-type cytochrome oxidase subunit 3
MSFTVDLVVATKVASLAIFLPIYVGALVYAFWKPNQPRFERYARLALHDDEPGV